MIEAFRPDAHRNGGMEPARWVRAYYRAHPAIKQVNAGMAKLVNAQTSGGCDSRRPAEDGMQRLKSLGIRIPLPPPLNAGVAKLVYAAALGAAGL